MTEKELVENFISKLNNRKIKQEVYVRASVADIIIDNEIAVEAKLLNVRKALTQAYSYKSKFKYSYILLPLSSKRLIKKYETVLMENKIRWMFLDSEMNLSYGRTWWKNIIEK